MLFRSGTQLSWFVNRHVWVRPVSETLHILGLSLVVGAIGLLDLRMLGMAKALPLGPFHRLVRWGIFGFIINLITGTLIFAGNPLRYIHNRSFQLKLVFLLLAGINALVFNLAVFRQAERCGPGDDAPVSAKVIAGISLFLLLGVICCGQMIAFVR